MQDRYAGDIGDFAKFALLRNLLAGTNLRLGLAWYLTHQPGDPKGDGRHTKYLTYSERNEFLYRACDAELYDRLAEIVKSGNRSVAVLGRSGILPPGTVYFESPLAFNSVASGVRYALKDRAERRKEWLRRALARTIDCQILMFDPDNGLEVKSIGPYSARGPKYVFFDELSPYVARGQSIIVYQHATRSTPMSEQVAQRLSELKQRLPLATEPFALIWRRVSARAFFIAPARNAETLLNERVAALLAGPLGRHFSRYP